VSNIQIEMRGLKEIDAKLKKLGRSLSSYMSQAMVQAGKTIIMTEGLKKYPPAGPGSNPPPPYYKRGYGTINKSGAGRATSENLGSKWYVDKVPFGAKVGNRASYAKWVSGENQAHFMPPLGWKKLSEVAKDSIDKVKKTLSAWLDKAKKDAGLK